MFGHLVLFCSFIRFALNSILLLLLLVPNNLLNGDILLLLGLPKCNKKKIKNKHVLVTKIQPIVSNFISFVNVIFKWIDGLFCLFECFFFSVSFRVLLWETKKKKKKNKSKNSVAECDQLIDRMNKADHHLHFRYIFLFYGLLSHSFSFQF